MGQLTCSEAVQRFFAYLDRALASDAFDDLEAHLAECMACCDKLAFTRQLDAFVKDHLPDHPMPPTLESRVRRALHRAAGGA